MTGLPPALRRPRVRLAAALVAVAAMLGAATLLTPAVTAVETAPVVEPVASTELVCAVTTATAALTSTVTAGVAPLPTVKDGLATLADLSVKQTSDPLRITQPGQTVSRIIQGRSGPALLARATGSFAQGLGADQAIRSGQGATRGLAASPCARPVTDAWLVGGGSTVGRLTQVLLVNDDDRPAQVDLLVYGQAGPVPAPGASGLVLPAGSRKQVRLDTLAPNQQVVAVHVVARSGRIGVVGLDQQAIGLIPMGVMLIPPTEPGTRLVIPGVPSVHYVYLNLLSPDVDTTASLTLMTPDGSIVPTGISTVQLDAGKVVQVEIASQFAASPAGLVIRSDAEIVAGVEIGTGDRRTLREKDATAPVEPLTAPGTVVGLAGGNLRHAVMLAAPGKAAKVALALYAPGSSQPVWRRTISVGSGALMVVAIPVTTPTASSTLVLTPLPGGGLVYASRQVTEAGRRGPMIALAPILPQRSSTLVPTVVSQPGSSIPGVSSR